eukprot:scaffold3101_cov202-Pinguiococcus_pyrenoidosus.AAC.4
MASRRRGVILLALDGLLWQPAAHEKVGGLSGLLVKPGVVANIGSWQLAEETAHRCCEVVAFLEHIGQEEVPLRAAHRDVCEAPLLLFPRIGVGFLGAQADWEVVIVHPHDEDHGPLQPLGLVDGPQPEGVLRAHRPRRIWPSPLPSCSGGRAAFVTSGLAGKRFLLEEQRQVVEIGPQPASRELHLLGRRRSRSRCRAHFRRKGLLECVRILHEAELDSIGTGLDVLIGLLLSSALRNPLPLSLLDP